MKAEETAIKHRYERVVGNLNERTRRLVAASEAMEVGRGGVSAVARATGLSRHAISQGIKELQGKQPEQEGRIRRRGGGRKKAVSKDPSLSEDLEGLIEPVTRADAQSPLRWTCKSVRKLAADLVRQGHQVSHQLVSELLHERGYSLQARRKTHEGGEHFDRNRQFEHLNVRAKAFLAAGDPVISVGAKKKELVGDCSKPGQQWRPQGETEQGQMYDVALTELERNAGWINVEIDHEAAAFAVESIRRWWNEVGKQQYPQARQILISADGEGSHDEQARLWKWELQRFADEAGLSILVCHVPAGTSKWNNIEYRLFAWISQNGHGKALESYAVILKRIAATTTEAGLTVECQLNTATYPGNRQVSDAQMATLSLLPDVLYGVWNYTIQPRPASD